VVAGERGAVKSFRPFKSSNVKKAIPGPLAFYNVEDKYPLVVRFVGKTRTYVGRTGTERKAYQM
jgi:uncharacterized protein YfaT (DUF1175 family)